MSTPYGSVIRRLREKADLSQKDLAKRAGLHRDTLVRAEQSGNVGVLLLYEIAESLDVDITAFFGGKSVAQAPASDLELLASLKPEQYARVMRIVKRYHGAAERRAET